MDRPRGGIARRLQAFALAHLTGPYEASMRARKEHLFSDLAGTIVEIGPGTGANLGFYSRAVRWIGIEPNIHAHAYLTRQLRRTGVEGRLLAGTAEHIRLDDQSADTVVATLVLCSVDDPAATMKEVVRILKPGGRFVFIEHVAANENTKLRKFQRFLNPVWKRLADGCHLTRDTERNVREAGFAPVEIERFTVRGGPISPHIAGWAAKPAEMSPITGKTL